MKFNKIILFSVLALLTACSNEDDSLMSDPALEMKGIRATIDDEASTTRAVAKLSNVVGREAFVTNDKIVFTNIHRATNPLAAFTYGNIIYEYDGNSWERTEGNEPEKIYWTDGVSNHTFIGYSLPSSTYHWQTIANPTGSDTFAGELGYEKDVLDYTSGNESIMAEDLLVNYSDTTKAESDGLSTKIKFTHALSNVRVVVNIKDFAASASAVDTKVSVSNMVLHQQPCQFTWGANSKDLTVKNFSEQGADHIKDLKLWCSKKDGEGTAQSKTFTFYGLTTPQDATFHAINGNDQPLSFSFTVSYPDAMNPCETQTKTYTGSFGKIVKFYSGKCTTLNISLNHKNEQMFMDVEYNDWNYVSTPDLGELRKKSTFMDINSSVTIHTDANATIYDATWLYKDGTVLKDIFGNDGSKESPYRISSASQLLSFAKEVSNGLSFEGKYVRMDADITMQASTAKTNVEDNTSTTCAMSWIGIGDATHPFNGTFLGGDRYINRLYGSPLFANIGPSACIEQLQITTIGSIFGGGALADFNAGVIAGCKIIDDLKTTGAALVGTNSGIIYASYHTGNTQGTAGLVDNNTGSIIGCYQAGDVIGGSPFSIAKTNSGTITCPTPTSLYEIQQSTFVEKLNTILDAWYASNTSFPHYHYVYSAASYPTVTK